MSEWTEKKIAGGRLIDHAGGRVVLRHELAEVAVPETTATYHPLPYTSFLERLERQLSVDGFSVTEENYMLSKNGQRMGALWGIEHRELQCHGFKPVVGCFQSYDKTCPQKVVAGLQATVCLNTMVSSEIEGIVRRNTKNSARDLMFYMSELSARLLPAFVRQNGTMDRFRNTFITDRDAHHLVIEAWKADAINSSDISRIVKEYESPRHDEFGARNVWSLLNAATETLKGSNLWELPRSTRILTELFANEIGAGPVEIPAANGVMPLEFPAAN